MLKSFCFMLLAFSTAQEFEEEERSSFQNTFCPGSNLPCKSLVECSAYAVFDDEINVEECKLSDGEPGICCPSSVLVDKPSPQGIGDALHLAIRDRPGLTTNINNDQYDLVSREGPKFIKNQIDLEDQLLLRAGQVLTNGFGVFQPYVQRQTPSFSHNAFFGGDKAVLDLAYSAVAVADATRKLQIKFNLSPQEAGFGLSKFTVRNTELSSACLQPPQCASGSKYRTIDGSCNNIENPLWGKSKTAFNRLMDPTYGDGIWTPRLSRDGSQLPLARFVSSSLVSDVDILRPELSLFVMQWGQFTDHDLTSTPTFTLRNGSGIECCSSNGFVLPTEFRHPQCLPLEVPADDPFFARFKTRCINFVRSASAPRSDCNLGYTDQMNQITHWMDGSMVYGSTDTAARELRTFQGGKLKTLVNSGTGPLPPQRKVKDDDCVNDVCFLAGDQRANEQPLLTTMHTIFIREHNRIVAILSQLNPSFNDEQLYQETRRIVVAEIQHINYNEWLPNIIGRKFMETFGLYPRRQGYFNGYDSKIDARTNNEFATAAFRFGHSLLPDIIQVVTQAGRNDNSYELSKFFNDPTQLKTPSFLDNVIRGMLSQPSPNFDSSVTSEVTKKLFRGSQQHGLDLVSLNIQRGRDHGIQGYNSYRSICGLKSAKRFEDLAEAMTPGMVDALRRVYKHVDDIDLFMGGIAERAAPGALLGPVFTCIVGDQFARLRLGDRFFYDIGNQPSTFKLAQLNEIRKVSLARILCDNTDGTLSEVQPLVFRLPNGKNRKVPCRSFAIPRMDLRLWSGERAL